MIKLNFFKTIRFRLIFSTMLVVIMVTLFQGVYQTIEYRKMVVSALESNMLDVTKIIASNLCASLEFGDYEAAMESLESIEEMSELEAITVYDRDGEVFAKFTKVENGELIPLENIDPGEEFVISPVKDGLRVFRHVMIDDRKLGTLATEISLVQAERDLRESQIVNLLVLGVFIVVITVISLLTANTIIKPIVQLRDFAQTLALGDFTARMDVTSDDEIGELTSSINIMANDMSLALQQVIDASRKVAESSSRLSSTSQHVTTTTEEISVNTRQITQNSITAAKRSKQAMDSAFEGEEVVKSAVTGMNSIWMKIEESAAKMKELGVSSQEIDVIVNVIDEIADQTNLLALNAAIEAARAGEQGKGFSVVADEIRKLAERTVKATKEISSKITTIQEDSMQMISSMKSNVDEVMKGTNLANEAGSALVEIREMITGTSDMIQQIADAASEHLAVTESMTNSVEETMKEAQELDQMAESLQQLVGRFRIL